MLFLFYLEILRVLIAVPVFCCLSFLKIVALWLKCISLIIDSFEFIGGKKPAQFCLEILTDIFQLTFEPNSVGVKYKNLKVESNFL